jgi:formate dehydrogenase iron-sulfur subunit
MNRNRSILIDTTRCTGCEECIAACKQENKLGKDMPRPWQRRIDDLSATRYSTIQHRDDGRNVRVQCRHCLEPACVSACLVGAMHKTPEGAVLYDGDLCMGCRYCMTACPYGIPRYDWDAAVPYVRKCTLCHPRIVKGLEPACVSACRYKAMIFGDREALLAEAHRRLEQNPDRYVHRVVGETEIGGTSILYLSDLDLGFLSFQPELGDTPLPERTWAALSKVPPLFLGMGGLMAGLYWFIGRRMRLAEEASQAAGTHQAPAPGQTDQSAPAPAAATEDEKTK